jgi:pimeloyl-ACP methyl ester carboxylesterase
VSARDRYVSLDGLRLHSREWGTSAAPAVLLLHGGSAHAHWWDFFAAAIADRYHAIALDLRGHGDSDHAVPPAYRLDDYAQDLAAFTEARGLERFDLIGHSLGGMVAAVYAAQSPERVRSLVSVDSPLAITPGSARYMTRLRNFPQPIYRDREQAIRRFRLLPTKTDAAEAVLAHVAAHGIRQLPDGRWTLKFDREAMAHNEPQDLTPRVRTLTCPILFVRGAQSAVLPHAALTAVLETVRHAETVEIPHAHHHVMLDNPAAFERAVRGFLDRVADNRQQTARQQTRNTP